MIDSLSIKSYLNMENISLDGIIIKFPASIIIKIIKEHFLRQTLYDEVTGSIIVDNLYLNLNNFNYWNRPLGIKKIKIDLLRDIVTISITAKILLQYYSKLITWETIKIVLENLIKLGFINFNPDRVIYLATVKSFDLTKDIPLSMPAENYLRDLRILGTKHNYRIKNYKSGLDVYSEAQSNKHRMVIYKKYDELCSNSAINRRLLKFINKDYFRDKLRIEASFIRPPIIKKYFKIPDEEDIMLARILNHDENVLLNYFNSMLSELKMKGTVNDIWNEDLAPSELAKKVGMREIIKVCEYNRNNISNFLKTKLKGKKNPSFYMPAFDKELKEMKSEYFYKEGGAKTIEEIRNKLGEN